MKKIKNRKLSAGQKQLREIILSVSYKNRLSHLGSCLSSVDLIDEIYNVKDKDDIFVLSNGHAGIALYAVLEKHGFIKDQNVISELHIHPDRNKELGIYVSTGSLGQGLPIALGMALANNQRNIYCMISDGETMEGSIWESFRVIADKKIMNIKIVLNANGWGAYDKVNLLNLKRRIKAFGFIVNEVDGHSQTSIKSALKTIGNTKPHIIFAHTIVEHFPFLKGQDAHYYTMTENDYLIAMKGLK